MPIYSSDSDDDVYSSPKGLFGHGHGKSLHVSLGGGKAADILLWRNKKLSAAILIGFTVLWFLFEVVEYNFVTLVCHISMIMMLFLFTWSTWGRLINWNYPNPGTITIRESTCQWLFAKMNRILLKFYDISSGNDLKNFFVAIVVLWILSGLGDYYNSLNLLYTGFLCLIILPALYERYQNDVDYLASKGNRDMKKLYKKFDYKVLNKIPRGPTKGNNRF